MAKFYGSVGFMQTVETSPGIWEEQIVERSYAGDVFRNIRRWQGAEKVNDDFTLNNQISIVADPFAFKNLGHIRYVTWMNSKWEVSSVEVQYPRMILEVGGVYNGPQT